MSVSGKVMFVGGPTLKDKTTLKDKESEDSQPTGLVRGASIPVETKIEKKKREVESLDRDSE